MKSSWHEVINQHRRTMRFVIASRGHHYLNVVVADLIFSHCHGTGQALASVSLQIVAVMESEAELLHITVETEFTKLLCFSTDGALW
jgi:hypothetical protein